MEQLKTGKILFKDLANWFGIKLNTLEHTKEKRLKELETFATFELCRGGVEIKEVKIPVYAKQGSKAMQIIRKEFFNFWHKSGLDTAARVGTDMWKNIKELSELISEKTCKAYVAKIRAEFFGKVYLPNDHGTLGRCEYTYVVANRWSEAEKLNEIQIQQINQIKKEIYVNEKEPLLYEALKCGEITEEQYDAAIAEWNSKDNRQDRYERFIEKIVDTLGFSPQKVTQIIKELYFNE